MVGLAALSVLNCALPSMVAWPAAMLVLGGGAWQVRREGRRPARMLMFGPLHGLEVDGMAVAQVQLHWRGPLAFVSWHHPAERRNERLVWWPDTLPARQRRELRLAAGEGAISPRTGVMAP
jgi:hypothetical protein